MGIPEFGITRKVGHTMTQPHYRVLVIEDELPIRRFLRASLSTHNYELIEVGTARDGITMATTKQPDIILLDLGLPDNDGLNVTRQIREWSQVPIIVISARGQEQDKVAALDAGADDYLTKPFGVDELMARMRVALRHLEQKGDRQEEQIVTIGNITVDLPRRHVRVDDTEVHLTPIEYTLLTTLVRYRGRVVTHRQLLEAAWGPHYVTETHYLRVYMGQLRHKIEADAARPRYLITEPGIGYRLRDGE